MVSSGLLGPLTEDSRLTLYCVATGGRPPPEVTWWRGSELLANRSLVLGEDGSLLSARHAGGTGLQVSVGVHHVRTELTIPALTRNHARANLTCRASNNNLTEPLHTTVSLDLYCELLPTFCVVLTCFYVVLTCYCVVLTCSCVVLTSYCVVLTCSCVVLTCSYVVLNCSCVVLT
ncbi:hypothetical protein E2C01_039746 [Portunus trituberculatus]|uniref:Ig-like domain-containing protein n=1 Tax=Portunus trituberculatus TaxID=210409 RepID=A0A5B7FKS0_PORTR|nr:hypothetical protein [Portunus trituberculatus]